MTATSSAKLILVNLLLQLFTRSTNHSRSYRHWSEAIFAMDHLPDTVIRKRPDAVRVTDRTCDRGDRRCTQMTDEVWEMKESTTWGGSAASRLV